MALPQSIVYAEANWEADGDRPGHGTWWATVLASDHTTQLVSRGPYPDQSAAQHAAVLIAEKLAQHVKNLEWRSSRQ